MRTINYTFSTNTFSGTTPGVGYIVSRSSTILSDGWVLINAIVKVTGSSATSTLKVTSFVPGSDIFGANIGDSIFVSNAQLELGAYPTSDIITAGATVTRAADVTGGTGFNNGNPLSSSIGQNEGTIYYEFTPAQTMVGFGGRILTALAPNTNPISGSVAILLDGNDRFQFLTFSASSATIFNAVITTFPSPVTASRSYKLALAYSSSNSKAYINGSQVYSNTSTWPLNGITGSQGPMNRIWLSNDLYYTADNGNLFKTVAIYNTRLSDSELIALTT